MSDDFFNTRTKAIGPVGRAYCTWDIDALIEGILPGEFGEKSEVFLKQVDVKKTGCAVGVF